MAEWANAHGVYDENSLEREAYSFDYRFASELSKKLQPFSSGYIHQTPSWNRRSEVVLPYELPIKRAASIYKLSSCGRLRVAKLSESNNLKGETKQIGRGFAESRIFGGSDGVIYALTPEGELFAYQHDKNYSFVVSRKKLGSNLGFSKIFSGGDGKIYTVSSSGRMKYYKHDKNFNWIVSGKEIGRGFSFGKMFAGSNGKIYGVDRAGKLYLYQFNGQGWSVSGKVLGSD